MSSNRGTCSQSLTMNRVTPVTNCLVGVMANEDRLVFRGTINATGVQYNLWSRYISLIVGSTNTGRIVRDVCNVKIDSCQHSEVKQCYCMHESEQVYNVFFNLKATEELIDMSVRMLWPRRDFEQVVTSNWLDVPRIYTAKSEVNMLQVNLENITLSSSCKLPARQSPSYMQYCCFHSPRPCVATIVYQGTSVSGNPCAVGNFLISQDNVYKFSHTVCGRESPRLFACVGEDVIASHVQVGDEEEVPPPSYNGYRNAAIFLASVIAIGLIIATVHRLDASLLFSSGSRRRMETMSIMREDAAIPGTRRCNCC
ncbi:hypothetical protein BsWGS_16914 [Bradybaena similaris]